MTDQQITNDADYTAFLEYLIDQCELGRHAGSDIGVAWLENLCRQRLERLRADEQVALDTEAKVG